MKHCLMRVALATACAMGPFAASAQSAYPERPIRMILPFSPGGGTDAVGRIVAKELSDRLGQQVIVDNRAGAGSTIGTNVVAKAEHDGYTLLFASAAHAFSPTYYKKLPYSQDDFAPIAMVSSAALMLAINPNVPARDLKTLIALFKANPGKYTYGTSGKGTTLHIAAVAFNLAAGVDVVHVPYRGEGPALADLLSGQVSFMVNQASSVAPYVKAGKLIGIGVTTPARFAPTPEVPTLAEGGLTGFNANAWNVLLAPKGTPPAIVQKLNKAVNEVLASPETRARFADLGVDVVPPSTPESTAAFISAETARWAPIIRSVGVEDQP